MRKISLLLSITLLTSALIFTSCKKDDNTTPGDDHSGLTVEENKDFLYAASNDAIDQMEALQNSDATASLEQVANLLAINDPFSDGGMKIQSLLKGIEDFSNNPSQKSELLKSLKSSNGGFPYDDLAGEYNWNSGTQTWDKTASTQIILKFPSTEGGTENNVVLTFASYSEQQVMMEGATAYLPTGASLNLTVDGTKELELIFSATYKADGMPKTMDLSLFINPFNFTASIENTDTKISEDFAWTLDGTNIVAEGTTLNGDFSVLAGGMGGEPGGTITSASAYVQIFDARLEATANVAELMQFDEPTVEQLNANTTILLKWANDDVKIADGEFYQKTAEDLGIMLIFADGTEVDAEVFFEVMVTNFENFFENLENDLAL